MGCSTVFRTSTMRMSIICVGGRSLDMGKVVRVQTNMGKLDLSGDGAGCMGCLYTQSRPDDASECLDGSDPNEPLKDDCSRTTQRKFVSNKLATLRDMSPKLYAECFVQPALQYFLATLCDLKVEPNSRTRLGLRYENTPEVRRLLSRLQNSKFVNSEKHGICPNAVISALKEILTSFPGGIFNDLSQEFYGISLSSPLDITIVYLHGLLETLPYFLRQFTYLICRSLRNLVEQSAGGLVTSYTDLLMLFAPALFPSSVGHVPTFLRAARLTLVMVDRCEQVFQPVMVWLDDDGNNLLKPVTEDEAFFHDIFASLQRLEATLEPSSSDDEDGDGEGSVGTNSSKSLISKSSSSDNESNQSAQSSKCSPTNQYYQFTYVDL